MNKKEHYKMGNYFTYRHSSVDLERIIQMRLDY